RISEFNDMIGELVQNEDAPFLYERLGNRYDHYLLDEFQDTSRMQWLNLVPLVYEGISKNQLNFIVGDPKQSIYRFKNGLAQQFVALPEIYNPDNEVGLAEKSAYFEQLGEKTNLEFNWRSASEIVEFNNNLFSSLSQKLSPETREFYKDVVQTPKSDASGLVNIKATNFKSFKESWEENIEVLIQWIEDCFADGYKGKDICILVLKNKECNKIAMELTNRKYKVVSAEALWVDTDQTVKWIVAFLMKRMWQSNDNVTKRFMNQTIQVKNLGLEEYNQYIKSKEGTDGKKYRYVDEDEFLNDFFKGKDNFYKTYESLHDLVSQFCTLAQIDPLQNHYVHHFLDMVYQFELIHGPDLPEFLAWYEEFGKSNSVNLPQDEETINVMTVHKSKGLEFPVVMVMDFIFKEKAGRKSKFLLKTNKGIGHFTPKNTELIQELNAFQESENEMIITDSFNAFYVALTRPKDRLYVTCVQTSHAKSAMFTELESYLNNELSSKLDAEDGIYKIGERIKVSQNAQTTNEDSIFYPRSLNDFLWFPSIALSNDSKISEEADLSDAQRFGNQFHLLLSELRCEEDIESKLNELILIGEIDLVYKEEMKNQAKTLWQKTLQPLYQDADQIITEQSILWKEEDKISRPDLIVIKNGEVTVIDFKTGAEYKSHHNQVKKYSSLLQKMNFKKVKGALLYTQENKLVWVN
ncbi:MAG: ATP-dependent exoDNAse (exonuclease V) beta subunit, partial [Psychromonas sp.]